jgi:hypothetical protein
VVNLLDHQVEEEYQVYQGSKVAEEAEGSKVAEEHQVSVVHQHFLPMEIVFHHYYLLFLLLHHL